MRLRSQLKRLLRLQVVVSLLIIAAYFMPKSPSNLILHISAEAVELQLAAERQWTWPGRLPAANHLSLSRVTSIESGLFRTIDTAIGDAWITIEGGSVSLDSLTFEKQGVLEIAVPEDGQVQFALRGSVRGQFQLLGEPVIAAGTSAPDPLVAELLPPLHTPEAVVFRSSDSTAPAMLHLSTSSVAKFRDLPIQGLRLQHEVTQASGERAFESTIHGGTLVLADVSREVDIKDGQALRLDGLVGRVSLTVGKSVDLVFVGSARHVETGFFSSFRNITPSWLEWCYYMFTHHILFLILLSTWLAIWQLWQNRKTILKQLR